MRVFVMLDPSSFLCEMSRSLKMVDESNTCRIVAAIAASPNRLEKSVTTRDSAELNFLCANVLSIVETFVCAAKV